jgi:hypothetical protein
MNTTTNKNFYCKAFVGGGQITLPTIRFTQNGEVSLMIKSVQQFQKKETLIAALKIIDLSEKDGKENKGLIAEESRAQLCAARQRGK